MEAPRQLPTDPAAPEWPRQGAIEFKELDLAYEQRPDYNVLKQLSFSIQGGEKVGLIGRTGSGKTTILSALFRLVEAKNGCIEIDGINIATLGLERLRKSLAIIPQSPTLFEGTVRSNLLNESSSDEDLWNALEHAGLKAFVQSQEGQLDMKIEVEGGNLSQGQKQLLCMARAILAKPKILIMDEATASVDMEADSRIQELIRTEFKDTTVLTIAHRLATISEYDRIMVLDDGRIAEFDTPQALLQDPNSHYAQMVRASHIDSDIN